jgi:hypothetical protein
MSACRYCKEPMVGEEERAYLHRDGKRDCHLRCWTRDHERTAAAEAANFIRGGRRGRVPPKPPAT